MYVCLCKGITDTQIRTAVRDGATSLREVRSRLGVASQCGKCGLLARQIVSDSLEQPPVADESRYYALPSAG